LYQRSEECTLLRGVHEFPSIISTFICDLGEIRHKRAGHNDFELLRVFVKIVDGKAVPKPYVILKVKNACYGLHYVQSCCILLKVTKSVIHCIKMNCIYFGS